MGKRILSLLVTLSLVISAFPLISVFAEEYERGTFTLENIYGLERTTGTVNFSGWKGQNLLTGYHSGRVYNTSGDPRDEAMLQFSTTATGLNDDDKIILKVGARANTAIDSTVRIVGIADENYVFNGTLPVVNRDYTFTTTEKLSSEYKEFEFDVTSYVKDRLNNNNSTISFLVEFVDNGYVTGSGNSYMYLALTDWNIAPELYYEVDTSLDTLSYNSNDIKLNENQKFYTVILNDTNVPHVSATAVSSDAQVDITQADTVPGTATIKVTLDNVTDEYKVAFITSEYIGELTFDSIYSATRTTNADSNMLDSMAKIKTIGDKLAQQQIRTDSNKRVREEGILRFDISDFYGLNLGQRVKLKVTASANDAAAGKVNIECVGIDGEDYYNGTSGLKYAMDSGYKWTSYEKISKAAANYEFDITEYVSSKLKAGEETVSFILRPTTGYANATVYINYGPNDGDNATLTVKETDVTLLDLKVNDVSIEGFNKDKLSYTTYIPDDTLLKDIVIEPIKKDSDASEYIELPDTIPGTAFVEIYNIAGKSTTYEIKLRYESSKTNPTIFTTVPYVTYKDSATDEIITSLTPGGKVKAELNLKALKDHSDVTFVTALYNDGFLVDKISSKKSGSESVLINTLDVTLSDVSKATVKSFILDGYGSGKNIINCAQLKSGNSNIKSLIMKDVEVEGFDTDILDYTFNIPASVINYPEFEVISQDSGTKSEVTVPVYLPGAVKIKTTADNGDSKTYTVTFNRGKEEITNITMDYAKLDGVNKTIGIIENIQKPIYNPTPEKPVETGESTGADFNKEYAYANCQNPINFLTDRSNIWIADMDDRFVGAHIIALPFDGINPSNNPIMKDYVNKTGFITFDINRSATVYVLHSNTPMPAWAAAEGFETLSDLQNSKVFTSSTDGLQVSSMNHAYKKYYEVEEWSEEPITVSLGGISSHNYWWIIVDFDK